MKTPQIQATIHITLPRLVTGQISPYPTIINYFINYINFILVVIVKITTQKAFQVYEKGLSSLPISKVLIANPSTNVEKVNPIVNMIYGYNIK